MKNLLLLEHYYLPEELERRIGEWVEYYNHQRYHESLDNCTPAQVYFNQREEKVKQREKIKHLTLTQRRKNYIHRGCPTKNSLLFESAPSLFLLAVQL